MLIPIHEHQYLYKCKAYTIMYLQQGVPVFSVLLPITKINVTMKNRILHADDDTLFSGIVKKILYQQGFEVHSAFDGEQAWQLFNEMKFHLCLLDIVMPRLNGIDLGERIRARDKQIPIFYLSGEDIALVSAEVFGRGGANDYFPKTFNLRELTGKLQASFTHINNYIL